MLNVLLISHLTVNCLVQDSWVWNLYYVSNGFLVSCHLNEITTKNVWGLNGFYVLQQAEALVSHIFILISLFSMHPVKAIPLSVLKGTGVQRARCPTSQHIHLHSRQGVPGQGQCPYLSCKTSCPYIRMPPRFPHSCCEDNSASVDSWRCQGWTHPRQKNSLLVFVAETTSKVLLYLQTTHCKK